VKEFYPEFKKDDLINLDKYRIYLKMAINEKDIKTIFCSNTTINIHIQLYSEVLIF